jgi:hypothetical protein
MGDFVGENGLEFIGAPDMEHRQTNHQDWSANTGSNLEFSHAARWQEGKPNLSWEPGAHSPSDLAEHFEKGRGVLSGDDEAGRCIQFKPFEFLADIAELGFAD